MAVNQPLQGLLVRIQPREFMKVNMKQKIRSCKYIPLTEIIPNTWGKEDWNIVLESAPFIRGVNNAHTLVPWERFVTHCILCRSRLPVDRTAGIDSWVAQMRKLPADVYIDLES